MPEKKPTNKSQGGRPRVTLTEKQITDAETFAAMGLTQEQIAMLIGISLRKLQYAKKEFMHFLHALERGKARGIAKAAARIMKEINDDGGNIAATMFYLKTQGGWREKGDVNVNHSGTIGIEAYRDEREAAIKRREGIRRQHPELDATKSPFTINLQDAQWEDMAEG